jgi:molybdopterin-guanine dinucleotide biosynthesis protein A
MEECMSKIGSAIILCGGKSKRMGFDKASIRIGDRLLVDIISEKLSEIFEEIIFVADSKNKFKDCGFTVIEDIIKNFGPAGGIYTGLKMVSSEYVFVTACDMPFISKAFILYMMDLAVKKNVHGVFTKRGQRLEPLCSIYSYHMLPQFESVIREGDPRLLEIIRRSMTYLIEEEDAKEYDINLDFFTNLNYPSDLSQLDKL